MPYQECNACNIKVISTGNSDSRQEWCEDDYICPRCKTLYVHRKDFDQNGLIVSDTFERESVNYACLDENCNGKAELTGGADKGDNYIEVDYRCVKCKTLYAHRIKFDQNDKIISNTFNKCVASISKKEDDVREALGVEKRFAVNISITTIGCVHLKQVIVNAVDEDEAASKAKELVENGEADADGDEPEEDRHDYDYSNSNEWNVEVSDE